MTSTFEQHHNSYNDQRADRAQDVLKRYVEAGNPEDFLSAGEGANA